jgi:hypothetical protein
MDAVVGSGDFAYRIEPGWGVPKPARIRSLQKLVKLR